MKSTHSDILSNILEERRSIIFVLVLNFHAVSVLIYLWIIKSYGRIGIREGEMEDSQF